MDKLTIYRTHIEIPNYDLGDCPYIEKSLSIYDHVYHRVVPIGYIYDKEHRILKIPAGVDIIELRQRLQRLVEYTNTVDECGRMSLRLKTEPRSELQKEAIRFLLGLGEFQYTKRYSQLILNLDTGEGKTFCAIAAACVMRYKTLIITHQTNIKNQWQDAFVKFTDINERSIVDISSSMVAKKLMEAKSNIAKVYIVNHDTLRSLITTLGEDFVRSLVNKLKIGLKIYDEFHLEFRNIMWLNTITNTKKTLYLSATLGRSDIGENMVFDNAFSHVPKYIQRAHGYTESMRHIKYLAYMYNSKPGIQDIIDCKNKYGFSGNKYASYEILRHDTIMFHLKILITKFILPNIPDYKGMVLFSTIEACEYFSTLLRTEFPSIDIGTYHSKISDDDKTFVIDNSNIIVSTSKSLGTGKNILNLKTIINCEAFSSKITGKQVSGRLRRLDNDQSSYYIEMIDYGFKSIKNQYNRRIKEYKKIFGALSAYKI